ncbi:MAG TPA: hypothetical protein PLL77_16290, partial [Pyrinomonadaceae bacterium]|nr:hypothetical protein [Pyrinomonadaceae bacterium]
SSSVSSSGIFSSSSSSNSRSVMSLIGGTRLQFAFEALLQCQAGTMDQQPDGPFAAAEVTGDIVHSQLSAVSQINGLLRAGTERLW